MRTWVVVLVLGAFLWAMWSVNHWLPVALLIFATGLGLLAVGLMKRRPLKPMQNGDISIFPEIIEGRVLETIQPGLGNFYLRAICLVCGLLLVVLGTGLVATILIDSL